MPISIGIVNPNTTRSMTVAATQVAAEAAPGATVVGITARTGVAAVESHTDEAIAAAQVVASIRAAEAAPDRPDAYVIACFGDTGVHAARECARGPVVGMSEGALLSAALLAGPPIQRGHHASAHDRTG